MADTEIQNPTGNIRGYRVGNLIIKVDRSKCISCGSCAVVAPDTFELDNKMISVVKQSGPYDGEKVIKEASDGCAVEAISVEVVRNIKE